MLKDSIFRRVLLIITIALVITTAGVAVYSQDRTKVVESVVIEAGSPLPPATAFFAGNGAEAAFVTDLSAIKPGDVGTYPITVQHGHKNYEVVLVIKDTVAPTGQVKSLDLYSAEDLDAGAFVDDIQDATAVSVAYGVAPDLNSTRQQTVTIVLTDAAGNRTEYDTTLRISRLKNEPIHVELSDSVLQLEHIKPLYINEQEDGDIFIVGDALPLTRVGQFLVQISMDGLLHDVLVDVVDTIAPTGTAVNQAGWTGETFEPASFVTDISDQTSVTVQFQIAPDFSKPGEQQVVLLLTDESNNVTPVTALLTLTADTESPKIIGLKKATFYIGIPASYKKGVYAEDNRDGTVPIAVDSSQVNLKVAGEYKAIYTATDSSGNTTTQEVSVTVKEQSISIEDLEALGDQVLSEIVTDDMTKREKAWQIYQYVNTHLNYTGYSDKTDWMKEAQNGIVNGVGDCFTYYSMSQLLLNRVGIETLSIERANTPEETRHYWHMINCGDGWYHFDACIHVPAFVSFMLTDAELDAFSELKGKNNYYYRYDRENYPATPES